MAYPHSFGGFFLRCLTVVLAPRLLLYNPEQLDKINANLLIRERKTVVILLNAMD